MFVGDQNGIDVWYKLGTSQDPAVLTYFNSLRAAAQKYQSIWFSDFEEQKKKKLNNQITYHMFYDVVDARWHIELFNVPKDV